MELKQNARETNSEPSKGADKSAPSTVSSSSSVSPQTLQANYGESILLKDSKVSATLQEDSIAISTRQENIPSSNATSFNAPVELARPSISAYQDPIEFLKAMLAFRKTTEKSFSVHIATSTLRRVSPSLVSLVLKRKRKITLDRCDEFSKLMQLNAREKVYFKSWIARLETADGKSPDTLSAVLSSFDEDQNNRKEVGTHLLSDWINVYVKDCFQLPMVQKNPELIYQYLASHAEPRRIKKSFEFLLKEGYLRRKMDGSIVVETNLAVANPQVPSKKIRQFHKGAFAVAKSALDMFPPQERMANTLIVPLNPKTYEQLTELIEEFSEKLQQFAANNQEPGERLYQLILNLSPTGGKVE